MDRFLWIWFLVVLVFFSFSGTELPHYLLYGCTPLFVLMARHRQELVGRWLAFGPPLAFLLILLLLPEVLALVGHGAHRASELATLAEVQLLLRPEYRALVALALIPVLGLALWRAMAPWQGLLLVGLVQSALISGVVAPRVLDVLQRPVQEAAALARELGAPVVAYKTSLPSFSIYRRAITPKRLPVPGELALVGIDKLDDLSRALPGHSVHTVYRRGAVALVKIQ